MKIQSFTRFWVIIAAACVAVMLILAFWVLIQRNSSQEVLEQYNQEQAFIMRGAASSLEAQFVDLDASLGALRGLPAIQYLEENAARDALARKFEELSAAGLVDIGVLDADGTAVIFASERASEGVDYSWRSYFREAQARAAGDTSSGLIIEVQTIRPGELGFVLASPLYETAVDDEHPEPGGEFAGVLLAVISLDTFGDRFIASFRPLGQGRVFLADEALDIIWASDDSLEGQSLLAGANSDVFDTLVSRTLGWEQLDARGGSYSYPGYRQGIIPELIAYAPLNAGSNLMILGVWTPGEFVQQTSLSAFRGQQVVFAASILTLLMGVVVGGIVLNFETRRRFRAEKALRKSEREQAILEERNRLAGDLHDSVTQGLYGIVLHADAAAGQLKAGNPERAGTYLAAIKEAGKEALAEMRLLIYELRPPVLEQEGLAGALEARLFAVEKRAGISAEFVTNLKGRLPSEIEMGIYRIAQEALNNMLKHAKATEVSVMLKQEEEQVVLRIRDNGRGFLVEDGQAVGGMGLENMVRRAEQIEGSLHIESGPGLGTEIQVKVKR